MAEEKKRKREKKKRERGVDVRTLGIHFAGHFVKLDCDEIEKLVDGFEHFFVVLGVEGFLQSEGESKVRVSLADSRGDRESDKHSD